MSALKEATNAEIVRQLRMDWRDSSGHYLVGQHLEVIAEALARILEGSFITVLEEFLKRTP